MSKQKSVFSCLECGHKQVKWSGQCPTCSAWNTMTEEIEREIKAHPRVTRFQEAAKPVRLKEISSCEVQRYSSHLKEFDRSIGGGIVPGSLTLIGGDPGIGKSTIALQLAKSFAEQNLLVLYVSGEESLEQTSLRAKRLGIESDNIFFFSEIEVSEIIRHVEELQPKILIIDSIQIVYKQEVTAAPGSVSQVRDAAATFMELSKTKKISTLLIGHVTKSGEIAGPKILEHLVDTVLYFEGDKQQNFRLLRICKNRFGPMDEIAVFQMASNGLHEVANPSQIFLQERHKGTIGSCVIPALEGTRPILLEIQSLVTDTFFTTPSRRSTGLDANRLALLLAVMEKKARFQLHGSDVFVSVTGGFSIKEPAADLGILASIASSFQNRSIHSETLVVGEVGLGGEIRAVSRIESRIKEGVQMGFSRCIIPKRNIKGITEANLKNKIEIIGVEWVDDAISELIR